MVSRILKNAGVSPPEVHFLKEIAGLKKQIDLETNANKKKELIDKLRKYQLKLELALEKITRSSRHKQY